MLKTDITYTRPTTDHELREILALQRQNIPKNLSEDELKKEGFLTAQHTFDSLKRINIACPHIIAKHNNSVVGYALCMLNDFRKDVPMLKPMFDYLDFVIEREELSHLNYIIMGQVCVSKAYRKQGIFRGLYKTMKTTLQNKFDAIITEVNAKNKRSSEAHKAIGFEILDVHTENDEDWELIIMRL